MIEAFRFLFAPPRHLILLLVALWLGLYLSEKRVGRHRISKEALNNMIYYSILGYVIGGRVLFALANVSAFAQSPFSIFSINMDLFDPVGAFVTGLLVGFVYGQRHELPLWPTLDDLTPLFAALGIGLSLSHLAAGQPSEVQQNYHGELIYGMQLVTRVKFMRSLHRLLFLD